MKKFILLLFVFQSLLLEVNAQIQIKGKTDISAFPSVKFVLHNRNPDTLESTAFKFFEVIDGDKVEIDPLSFDILKDPVDYSKKNKCVLIMVEVLDHKHKKEQVDLPLLMDKLGEMEITSIMIEGGSEISGNALKEKLIDKVICFLAPKIIGGKNAPGPVGGQGIAKLKDFIQVKEMSVEKLGNDLVIEGNIH